MSFSVFSIIAILLLIYCSLSVAKWFSAAARNNGVVTQVIGAVVDVQVSIQMQQSRWCRRGVIPAVLEFTA